MANNQSVTLRNRKLILRTHNGMQRTTNSIVDMHIGTGNLTTLMRRNHFVTQNQISMIEDVKNIIERNTNIVQRLITLIASKHSVTGNTTTLIYR